MDTKGTSTWNAATLSADTTSPIYKPVYPHHLLNFTSKPEKKGKVKEVDSDILLPQLFKSAFNCLRHLLRLKALTTIS